MHSDPATQIARRLFRHASDADLDSFARQNLMEIVAAVCPSCWMRFSNGRPDGPCLGPDACALALVSDRHDEPPAPTVTSTLALQQAVTLNGTTVTRANVSDMHDVSR